MTEAGWLASEDPAAMLRSREYRDGNRTAYYGITDAQLRAWVEACRGLVTLPASATWQDLDASLHESVRFWAGETGEREYLPASTRAALLRCVVGNPFRPVMLTRTIPCNRCNGKGQRTPGVTCGTCNGSGKTPGNADWLVPHVKGIAADARERADWRLMPLLAGALEEAGCPTEVELPCPQCSLYRDVRGWNPGWRPERDPASGRHEGGWVNCQACNGLAARHPGFLPVTDPLLAHLRGPGPHGRGCHALALILGED